MEITAGLGSVELDKFGPAIVAHCNTLQQKPSISSNDVSSKTSALCPSLEEKKYDYVHS